MPPVALAALRTLIADRATSPLCMLVGDDDVEKSAVADEFIAMVDEGLQAFNVDRLHGGETRVETVVDAANLLPVLGDLLHFHCDRRRFADRECLRCAEAAAPDHDGLKP